MSDVKYQCEAAIEECITDLRIGFEWLEDTPTAIDNDTVIEITEKLLHKTICKIAEKLEEIKKMK